MAIVINTEKKGESLLPKMSVLLIPCRAHSTECAGRGSIFVLRGHPHVWMAIRPNKRHPRASWPAGPFCSRHVQVLLTACWEGPLPRGGLIGATKPVLAHCQLQTNSLVSKARSSVLPNAWASFPRNRAAGWNLTPGEPQGSASFVPCGVFLRPGLGALSRKVPLNYAGSSSYLFYVSMAVSVFSLSSWKWQMTLTNETTLYIQAAFKSFF